MITINGATLSFSNMGLFDSETEWIHPTVTTKTYELILVASGSVHLFEGDDEYDLKQGDLLLLYPNVEHGGTKISHGHTSFYWLHFSCDDLGVFKLPKRTATDFPVAEKALREIMHHQNDCPLLAVLSLAKFLVQLGRTREVKNKTAHEIAEYIRINRHRSLTVSDLAKRFGYAPDHLSRLLKKEFGTDAKRMIVARRMEYIEALLITTDYPLSEIADLAGFENDNALVKFFSYHAKTSPISYRNRLFNVHMNAK